MTTLRHMSPPTGLCTAVVVLVTLAGCGSSRASGSGASNTTAGTAGDVTTARIARSFTHALDASLGKGPRVVALNGPAKCRPAGSAVWSCTVTFDTASPAGEVDMEQKTYRVRLTSGTCWTATETGVTSGMPDRAHGCA